MEIRAINSLSFKRGLRQSEETEYKEVLRQAKSIAGNKGKSILIVPTAALPQSEINNTGVGNLTTPESLKFFEFAKKYWGINEVQILPSGQFHNHHGNYPVYSGSSMDLGNHMIDIKSHISDKDFRTIVEHNNLKNRINYANVVDLNSPQEQMLKKAYDNKSDSKAFKEFKTRNLSRLEPKALFRALRNMYGTADFYKWKEDDKNLFSLPAQMKEKRIKEIYELKGKDIDFYLFKQFLAEQDLKKAKEKLNSIGIKLNGDFICGFSYDEVWAHPKAFIPNTTIGWGLPALDFENPEGIKLLKEKVNFYAKRFDGLRVDAAWTYAKQPVNDTYRVYGDKILNIIDDEVKKAKGESYNLKNIMHEFAADPAKFNIFDGYNLKQYIADRTKIFTSAHMSEDFGSNDIFLKRGWNPENFIIGASNHDTSTITPSKEQAKVLSKILNIPEEKLMDKKEFLKAKLSEPTAAYNNMIYYQEALNLRNKTDKIPANYEELYYKSLQKGEAFNPMDALAKTFKAKGLDKENPKLYKKIIKYKKILEKKQIPTALKWITAGAIAICAAGLIYIAHYHKSNKNT